MVGISVDCKIIYKDKISTRNRGILYLLQNGVDAVIPTSVKGGEITDVGLIWTR